jgi:pyridoxal 5'-phosphate synthase pdxT subunit
METIGVLAIQGAFHKHALSLSRLGYQAKYVRDELSLNECDRLIIPGGESTTMLKLLKKHDLLSPLRTFVQNKPTMGTCAGLILMANSQVNFQTLNGLSITVDRNKYGRQKDSFVEMIKCSLLDREISIPVLFIRAPAINRIESKNVKVLASYNDRPILVQENRNLAMSFHPELTENTEILEYFLSL